MKAWTTESILEMARRMEARRDGFRVSADTAALVIEAVRHYAREHCGYPASGLPFEVDIWDKGMRGVAEHIATVTNLEVARAAFRATQIVRPGTPVTLRHGIRVVEANDEARR